MRADAKKNFDRLLTVAKEAIEEDGPDVSMRDIARRAEVGLATLLRHFPNREALFEALLRENLEALTKRADDLLASTAPDDALLTWFGEWVAFALKHKGVVAMLAAAHTNPESAMYVACAAVHSASERLLLRAQAEGTARTDMNGQDLFGLMSALGWLVDLPPFAPRAEHLSQIVAGTFLVQSLKGRPSQKTPS